MLILAGTQTCSAAFSLCLPFSNFNTPGQRCDSMAMPASRLGYTLCRQWLAFLSIASAPHDLEAEEKGCQLQQQTVTLLCPHCKAV